MHRDAPNEPRMRLDFSSIVSDAVNSERVHSHGLAELADIETVEWSLLVIAANILKLHYELKNGLLGTGLVIPKGFPVGLHIVYNRLFLCWLICFFRFWPSFCFFSSFSP